MDTTEPPARDPRRDRAEALRRRGLAMIDIARLCGVSVSTLHRWAAEDGWRLAELTAESFERSASDFREESDGDPVPIEGPPIDDPGIALRADAFDAVRSARAMMARAARFAAEGRAPQAEHALKLAERMISVGEALDSRIDEREKARMQALYNAHESLWDWGEDSVCVDLQAMGEGLDALLAGHPLDDLPDWVRAVLLTGASFAEALPRRRAESDLNDYWTEMRAELREKHPSREIAEARAVGESLRRTWAARRAEFAAKVAAVNGGASGGAAAESAEIQ